MQPNHLLYNKWFKNICLNTVWQERIAIKFYCFSFSIKHHWNMAFIGIGFNTRLPWVQSILRFWFALHILQKGTSHVVLPSSIGKNFYKAARIEPPPPLFKLLGFRASKPPIFLSHSTPIMKLSSVVYQTIKWFQMIFMPIRPPVLFESCNGSCKL